MDSAISFKCRKEQIQITMPNGKTHVVSLLANANRDEPIWVIGCRNEEYPTLLAALMALEAIPPTTTSI